MNSNNKSNNKNSNNNNNINDSTNKINQYDNKRFISRNYLNNYQTRNYNIYQLWPNYDCYIQHPQVQNFFILPSYFDKISYVPPNYNPPTPTTYHKVINETHTPQTNIKSQSSINSNVKKSKRKYQDIIIEDQIFNDHVLSVFLDFDNV